MLDLAKLTRYLATQLKFTPHTDAQGKTITLRRRKKMALPIVKQVIRNEIERFKFVVDSGD